MSVFKKIYSVIRGFAHPEDKILADLIEELQTTKVSLGGPAFGSESPRTPAIEVSGLSWDQNEEQWTVLYPTRLDSVTRVVVPEGRGGAENETGKITGFVSIDADTGLYKHTVTLGE